MKFRFLKLISLLFYSFTSIAQIDLVKYDELLFDSDIEQMSYQKVLHGDSAYLELLVSIDNAGVDDLLVDSYRTQYFDLIERLTFLKKDKSYEYSDIGKVFKKVHLAMLNEYGRQKQLYQVFESKEYNCATACALFSLIFSDLEIDYVIKSTTDHVFIIVNIDETPVVVETTDPIAGIHKLSKNFSVKPTAYERGLRLDSVYKYYNSPSLGLKEITGVLYDNLGIKLYDDGLNKAALSAFKKSYLLSPNTPTMEMIKLCISNLFYEVDEGDFEYVLLLEYMARFSPSEVDSVFLKTHYDNVVNELVSKDEKWEEYNVVNEYLLNAVLRNDFRKSIEKSHHFVMGRKLFKEGEYIPSLRECVAYCTATGRQDDELETMVFDALERERLYENDLENMIGVLDSISLELPLACVNHDYVITTNNYILTYCQQLYQKGEIKKGNQYLTNFEAVANNESVSFYNKDLVGRVFATLAVLQYRKGEINKSQYTLQRGLKYAPENKELIQRLNAIKSARN